MRSAVLVLIGALLAGCAQTQILQTEPAPRAKVVIKQPRPQPKVAIKQTRPPSKVVIKQTRPPSKVVIKQPRPQPKFVPHQTRGIPPRTSDASAPPAAQVKEKGRQVVLFATNRMIEGEGPLRVEAITYQHAQQMTYGVAEVSIPDVHKVGEVERPGRFLFFFREWESVGKHLMMQRLERMSQEQFKSALGGGEDSVLVFVHGYNVAFDAAIFKTAQIAFDAKFKGRVISFSWPSAGELMGYKHDVDSARASYDPLLELLKLAKAEAPDRKLIIVAHSLGSDVVFGALRDAALSGVKLDISELVFAAPDIEAKVFVPNISRIRSVAGNVTIYASGVDKALLASGKASYGQRIGYIGPKGPVAMKDVELIDVTAAGNDMLALNHSTATESRVVLEDLARLIQSGLHPPHARFLTLDRVPIGNPTYWRWSK